MNSSEIIYKLAEIVGRERVISDKAGLMVYESDAMPLEKHVPMAVVLPENANEISSILKILNQFNIPFTPRGSGTGLSGGCVSVNNGVVLSLTRMNRILEIDPVNRYAVVEPGVINQEISDEVAEYGLCFAPDPSSGHACTIGGNVAENAGGPHTMKYGVTGKHILGAEIVLANGEILEMGSKTLETPGYDLTGLICGSEGTFGIITKITVKLTPLPEFYTTLYAVFETIDDATQSVSGLLQEGILPAALELIDGEFIKALRDVFDLKFPSDAGAVLFIELDGPETGMNTLENRVRTICNKYNVREIDAATSAEDRAKLWKARKLAFGAVGRLSPNYYTQDGAVPRTRLPEMLRVIHETAANHGIRIANAFHAGDGNLHPCLMYDERKPGELEKVKKICRIILKACVDMGGTISGEHGIGYEKNNYMPWLFNENDLSCMHKIKEMFDPDGLLNPAKIFPDSFSAK